VCREGEEFDEAHSSYCTGEEGGPRSESYYSAKLQLVHIVQVTSKVWSPLATCCCRESGNNVAANGTNEPRSAGTKHITKLDQPEFGG
jgi:hypothetical protein